MIIDNLKAVYTEYPLISAENVYTSLEDAPVEDELALRVGDGDNALLKDFNRGLLDQDTEKLALTGTPSNPVLVVPLARTLSLKAPRMSGIDVLAQQRALAKAGLRKWGAFTSYYGKSNKKQVAAFQERVSLKRDGVYGPSTHAKLARYYDAYGAHLMASYKHKIIEDPRQKIVNAAVFGYNNRYYIHYTQSSWRMYGIRNHIKPPNIPRYEDCSSFVTWCYWVGNRPDPNQFGYNGLGYTGTLASHGHRVLSPQPADIALYGRYFPYHHVTIAIGNGKCISHGNEWGPLLLSLYYRGDLNHFRSFF